MRDKIELIVALDTLEDGLRERIGARLPPENVPRKAALRAIKRLARDQQELNRALQVMRRMIARYEQ